METEKLIEGILLVDKPAGITSFTLVRQLRRLLKVKKIGHAGTLDPFATGLMVMLIGRNYTRLSDRFLTCDKTYVAEAKLGVATDSFDCDGEVTGTSPVVPTPEQVEAAIKRFQGTILQTPPMFSAKKVGGKKLYDLARKGVEVHREPVPVTLTTTLVAYDYPTLTFEVTASKGTYIRSLAQELGEILGCGAHLTALRRTRSGGFTVTDAPLNDLDTASKDDVLAQLGTSLCLA